MGLWGREGCLLPWRMRVLSREFLTGFKRGTEENWRDRAVDPRIYGFHFQAGTRWNAGLSDEEVLSYENEICVR